MNDEKKPLDPGAEIVHQKRIYRICERRPKGSAAFFMGQVMTPIALRPKQAAAMLGIGLTSLYRRMADGSIATTRFGGARLIPVAEINRIASGLSARKAS